jgi:death-on-curing protein
VTAWRWLRTDIVLAIDDRQLAEHGGLAGIPNVDRIEAALPRAQNLAAYNSPDAAALAAAYASGLARNHGFADGNKRTAWVAARLFLADNGLTLRFDPSEAVRTMEALASGSLTEPELAEWFRQRILAR